MSHAWFLNHRLCAECCPCRGCCSGSIAAPALAGSGARFRRATATAQDRRSVLSYPVKLRCVWI